VDKTDTIIDKLVGVWEITEPKKDIRDYQYCLIRNSRGEDFFVTSKEISLRKIKLRDVYYDYVHKVSILPENALDYSIKMYKKKLKNKKKIMKTKPFNKDDIEDVNITVIAKGKHWRMIPKTKNKRLKRKVKQIKIDMAIFLLNYCAIIDKPLEELIDDE